jgi:hypothetical protein
MIIDLRSDTVKKPDKGLLEALMPPKVGDDVFREYEVILFSIISKRNSVFKFRFNKKYSHCD